MFIVLSGFGGGFPALKKTQRVVKGGDEVVPEVIKCAIDAMSSLY
jgi:hypothetical protein